jgi:biotin transport system substrate-specific component
LGSSPLEIRPVAPVLADLVPGARVRDAVLVSVYALAIAASAQLLIPLPWTPVPVTGQTFAVLLGAAALGTTRAAVGTGLYAAIGLQGGLGLPWFAAAGPATLGYVVGFVLAAVLIGRLARSGRLGDVRGAALAMVAGNLVIYVAGVAGLMLVLGMALPTAVVAGVLPFLAGDAAKITLAVALLPRLQRVVTRHGD